ncbi:MAG: hypothetical protein UMV23_00350 [Halanaerobium sp.]|nr:hypothetical protein [Halanaerobium sp.]
MKKVLLVAVIGVLLSCVLGSAALALPTVNLQEGATGGIDFILRDGQLVKVPYLELGLQGKAIGVLGLLDINQDWENGFIFYAKYPLWAETEVMPGISAAVGLAKLDRRSSTESSVLPVVSLFFGNKTNDKIELTEIVSVSYQDSLLFSYHGSLSYHITPQMAGDIGFFYLNDFQGNNFTTLSFGVRFGL